MKKHLNKTYYFSRSVISDQIRSKFSFGFIKSNYIAIVYAPLLYSMHTHVTQKCDKPNLC